MTVPVWMLVGFAAWTVLLLLFTVGIYRWSRILTGRAPIRGFRADQVEGADWYKRAMRAHASSIEKSPGFWRHCFRTVTLGSVAERFGEYAGCRGSDCPHHAIAGARMLRSDQHGGIRTLRILFRADRQFPVVDWDPAVQAAWSCITTRTL